MRTLPDKISELALASGTVNVDEAGYITNPDLWTRDFAEHIALGEEIVLTPDHWEIIDFVRDSYAEHRVAVDVRHVLKLAQNGLGMSKPEAKLRMLALFPYGYVKQAVKMAGMKQPRAWSTG
ncbi:MAG: TusE/DsrC/DsvC family sulfur relay protein [Rhodobacteraceae bacterium]|nr:TusE/DsrC/DsvC family sulfur relay protein [Paracoccaceae bacterium]